MLPPFLLGAAGFFRSPLGPLRHLHEAVGNAIWPERFEPAWPSAHAHRALSRPPRQVSVQQNDLKMSQSMTKHCWRLSPCKSVENGLSPLRQTLATWVNNYGVADWKELRRGHRARSHALRWDHVHSSKRPVIKRSLLSPRIAPGMEIPLSLAVHSLFCFFSCLYNPCGFVFGVFLWVFLLCFFFLSFFFKL